MRFSNKSKGVFSPGFVQRGLLHLQVEAGVLADHLNLGPHITLKINRAHKQKQKTHTTNQLSGIAQNTKHYRERHPVRHKTKSIHLVKKNKTRWNDPSAATNNTDKDCTEHKIWKRYPRGKGKKKKNTRSFAVFSTQNVADAISAVDKHAKSYPLLVLSLLYNAAKVTLQSRLGRVALVVPMCQANSQAI